MLDQDSESLAIFDPDTLSLTTLGTLDCNSWSTPASMGIARDGVGYVRYGDNEVFEVDLTTLDCTATTYSERSTGFGSFGMGFATESASTWRDQLFVANSRQPLGSTDHVALTLGTLPSQAEPRVVAASLGAAAAHRPGGELDHATGSVLQTSGLPPHSTSPTRYLRLRSMDGEFYGSPALRHGQQHRGLPDRPLGQHHTGSGRPRNQCRRRGCVYLHPPERPGCHCTTSARRSARLRHEWHLQSGAGLSTMRSALRGARRGVHVARSSACYLVCWWAC